VTDYVVITLPALTTNGTSSPSRPLPITKVSGGKRERCDPRSR
jgi:hypothetical protein